MPRSLNLLTPGDLFNAFHLWPQMGGGGMPTDDRFVLLPPPICLNTCNTFHTLPAADSQGLARASASANTVRC